MAAGLVRTATEERDRPAAYPAVRLRGIGQTYEPIARLRLEQLDVRRERSIAGGVLPEHHLVENRRLTPGS